MRSARTATKGCPWVTEDPLKISGRSCRSSRLGAPSLCRCWLPGAPAVVTGGNMNLLRTMSRLGPVGVGVATLTVLGMMTGAVVYAASSTAPPLVLCVDKRANVTAPTSGACPSGALRKEVATQAGLDEALAAVATQAS